MCNVAQQKSILFPDKTSSAKQQRTALKDVLLAMFTVYIDDSGTAPEQQIAIATAVIIPAARIVALDKEWETLRRREGFAEFHTSECVAANPDSEFVAWDRDKRSRVLSRIRQIGKKFGLNAVSLAIKKSDYDEIIPEEMRRLAGKYHYTWAMRNIISLLDAWAADHRVTAPFEYVYDWMDPKAQKKPKAEIDTVMAQAEDLATKRGNPGRYDKYSFRKRLDIPALQCTDLVAWTCYNFALFGLNNIPMSDIAKDCWNDYYNPSREAWLHVGTMTREQLTDWVHREQKDGVGIERLREWEAKHPKGNKQKKL